MNKIVKGIAAAILTCCFLLGCVSSSAHELTRENRGMFSWKSDVFQDGGAELFSFMEQNGFTELYQAFSSGVDDSLVSKFLINAQKKKIDVYVLEGDPSWAMDPRGEGLYEAVEKAEQIHRMAEGGIKGIVFDVEPYTTPEWSETAKDIMESFVFGMKRAYSEAAGRGFEVILCIPYYYDDMGVSTELKSLIRTGCDRIAIMNYYKSQEAAHIQNETRWAQRYGKGVINIFEFKPPGEQGLEERNTYFSDGFAAALTSFDVIAAAYPDADLIMAAHDYEALKEVSKSYG